jgi:DNA-binding transcriptional ArsR family regulator
MQPEQLAAIGTVIGSETRAAIICALMSGTAHTGGELARHCGVAPSTVSEHIGILLDAGLVTLEAQGRHRYVRLRSREVADAVEQLGTAFRDLGAPPLPRLPVALAFARTCYDHLAGHVGVMVHDRLHALGHVESSGDGVRITDDGWAWLDQLGIAVGPSTRPPARRCLDWSERRAHLGGPAATALLDHMLEQRWFRRNMHQRRVLELTDTGRRALAHHLDLEVR